MALRLRRPPAHEWLPMLVGLILGVSGVVVMATSSSAWGWALLVPGALLFYGVVLYRMLIATADD